MVIRTARQKKKRTQGIALLIAIFIIAITILATNTLALTTYNLGNSAGLCDTLDGTHCIVSVSKSYTDDIIIEEFSTLEVNSGIYVRIYSAVPKDLTINVNKINGSGEIYNLGFASSNTYVGNITINSDKIEQITIRNQGASGTTGSIGMDATRINITTETIEETASIRSIGGYFYQHNAWDYPGKITGDGGTITITATNYTKGDIYSKGGYEQHDHASWNPYPGTAGEINITSPLIMGNITGIGGCAYGGQYDPALPTYYGYAGAANINLIATTINVTEINQTRWTCDKSINKGWLYSLSRTLNINADYCYIGGINGLTIININCKILTNQIIDVTDTNNIARINSTNTADLGIITLQETNSGMELNIFGGYLTIDKINVTKRTNITAYQFNNYAGALGNNVTLDVTKYYIYANTTLGDDTVFKIQSDVFQTIPYYEIKTAKDMTFNYSSSHALGSLVFDSAPAVGYTIFKWQNDPTKYIAFNYTGSLTTNAWTGAPLPPPAGVGMFTITLTDFYTGLPMTGTTTINGTTYSGTGTITTTINKALEANYTFTINSTGYTSRTYTHNTTADLTTSLIPDTPPILSITAYNPIGTLIGNMITYDSTLGNTTTTSGNPYLNSMNLYLNENRTSILGDFLILDTLFQYESYAFTPNITIGNYTFNITLTPYRVLLNFTRAGVLTTTYGHISDEVDETTEESQRMDFNASSIAIENKNWSEGKVSIMFNQNVESTNWTQYYEFLNNMSVQTIDTIELLNNADFTDFFIVKNRDGTPIKEATVRAYANWNTTYGTRVNASLIGQRVTEDNGRSFFYLDKFTEMRYVVSAEGYETRYDIKFPADDDGVMSATNPREIILTESTTSHGGAWFTCGVLKFNHIQNTINCWIYAPMKEKAEIQTPYRISQGFNTTQELTQDRYGFWIVTLTHGVHFNKLNNDNITITIDLDDTYWDNKTLILADVYNTTEIFEPSVIKTGISEGTLRFMLHILIILLALGSAFLFKGIEVGHIIYYIGWCIIALVAFNWQVGILLLMMTIIFGLKITTKLVTDD